MLERLEVFNFKSYKGRHLLGPLHPFTCVIGPNGAGKSNCMDAISFVLGVKSSHLRSTGLKDLIYRGPGESQRQELGDGDDDDAEAESVAQAKEAWVLAVYKDKDGDEWTFKRSINLSGTSEYRLNDKKTTYAEYNDALEQHNILVKAKNFLVFQGDVEAVASQSSKDLSRLIEQISGSLELKESYEAAKAAQEKASENSTFNYNKRRGINAEYKQLKEQKTEARKFEKKKQQLAASTLHHLLWKLHHIELQISFNSESIQEANKTLTEAKEGAKEQGKEVQKHKKIVAAAAGEVNALERKIKGKEKAIEDQGQPILEIEEKLKHAKRKKATAESILKEVEANVERMEEKVTSYEKELDKLQKARDREEAAAKNASASRGLVLSDDDLAEYRQLRDQTSLQAVRERNELHSLERDRKTSDDSLQSLGDKLEGKKKRLNKETDEVTDLEMRKKKFEEKVAELKAQHTSKTKERDGYASQRKKALAELTEVNERLNSVYYKLQQAGSDKRQNDKEQRLKDVVEGLKRIYPGRVKGRVIDLCKPNARKYETAVVIALGRNIDSIVVDTDKTAMECINYLRSQQSGVATFIPLDTIQVKHVSDKYRSYARGARLAIDCLQCAPEVLRAMEFACGTTLICDSLDVAKYVCYEKGQEVKAVTLDGTVIHKAGMITGGPASANAGAKRWDQKEFDELKEQEHELTKSANEIRKSEPKRAVEDQLTQDITGLDVQLEAANDDLSATNSKLQGRRQALDALRREVRELTNQYEEANSKHQRLLNEMDQLRTVVYAADDAIFDSFCRRHDLSDIREYEESVSRADQAEANVRAKYAAVIKQNETQLNWENRQLETQRERLDSQRTLMTSAEESIASLEKQKQKEQRKLRAIEDEVAKQRERLADLNGDLEEKTQEFDEAKKAKNKAAKAVDKVLKGIANWNDEIEKLSTERFGILRKCRLEDIDLPLLNGSLDDVPIEDAMKEVIPMETDENDGTQRPIQVADFGLEIDTEDLDDDERDDGSPEKEQELLAEIRELTDVIEKMTPNMKAIERVDDAEARLKTVEAEFETARKEAKQAKDHFTDIKTQRADLFNKAYTHISERIDEVYKDLTKGKASPLGGVAYLTLENSEEPYLSGIKYHAMPPMKRFRDMEQLSGGEKTMAALALLFAIHSYHPSPFFVLDEVDAALDNTNVSRIANYVRHRANDDFQFVVISLKGAFYEKARALVGICRDQDKGGSRVLTLDLSKYEE